MNSSMKCHATPRIPAFVGYFPAEDPQYSVICAVYSRPTRTSYQGGGIPAAAIKTLVDYVYTNDPRFRTKLPKK